MFDLIIFDCDGVLIDSEWLANQVEVEELDGLGYTISMKEYLDVALGRTNDEVEERLLTHYGFQLPPGYWQRVRDRQKKEFQKRLTPIPGVEEVIQKLSVPCCVASSSDAERLKLTLGVTGLLQSLEGRIFGRECVERGKPEPDIFLYAAKQMGTSPSKCLVVEDSIHGISAAKAAGMEVWAFCGGRHFTPERKDQLFQTGAHYIFDDMRTIPGRVRGEL